MFKKYLLTVEMKNTLHTTTKTTEKEKVFKDEEELLELLKTTDLQ